ncbi:hypothetical protein Lal_00028448 [Lupinus albus]|nr:hypothetical protein Lal_00028448 [Lupinus albus]
MLEEIDIIVNFAASTKFHERFDTSMGVNTMGALHVLNFAKNCHKYSFFSIYQPEHQKLDIHEEKKLMENKIEELRAKNADEKTVKYGMKDYGIERFVNLYQYVFYTFKI